MICIIIACSFNYCIENYINEKGAQIMDIMNTFLNALTNIKAFSPSPDNIWKNEKISPFIFQSHFDENIIGGSKGESFIEEAVELVKVQANSHGSKNILDLGCGPGVYTLPLAKYGFQVTGIDFSKQSIDYATKKAVNADLNVKYLQRDFFNIDMYNEFDMALLLYEIYSTFNRDERKKLLKSIWKVLSNSGIFILDVASEKRYVTQNTMKIWDHFSHGEIYIPEPHYLFFSIEKYPNNLIFNHSLFLFENKEIVDCYDWVQCFNIKDIKTELTENNFEILEIFSDLTGKKDNDNTNTIALVCRKCNSNI